MKDLLKLYLLTQYENLDLDTFDSCIVAAYSEEEAKQIHPYIEFDEYYTSIDEVWDTYTWASCPENVECKYIGNAAADVKPNSIVCSSFNAG